MSFPNKNNDNLVKVKLTKSVYDRRFFGRGNEISFLQDQWIYNMANSATFDEQLKDTEKVYSMNYEIKDITNDDFNTREKQKEEDLRMGYPLMLKKI